MERFVREQNVKLLRKALSMEADPEKRGVLERLLAEQQEGLAIADEPADDAARMEQQQS